jgi:hypothetical protein
VGDLEVLRANEEVSRHRFHGVKDTRVLDVAAPDLTFDHPEAVLEKYIALAILFSRGSVSLVIGSSYHGRSEDRLPS